MASRRLAPFVCSAAHYVEPRLLLHDKKKSYGDAGTGNLLIHGDNLLALRALLPKYGGRVKCIAAFFINHVTLFDFRRIKRQKEVSRYDAWLHAKQVVGKHLKRADWDW